MLSDGCLCSGKSVSVLNRWAGSGLGISRLVGGGL